jgi:hypothetical protein
MIHCSRRVRLFFVPRRSVDTLSQEARWKEPGVVVVTES